MSVEEVGFARDSPLEGDGFELSVPGARGYRFEPSSVASWAFYSARSYSRPVSCGAGATRAATSET